MNAFSTPRPEAAAPTSLRAQSKLKTRRRVLEAARQLFMERGYEEATIRDIASAAGLSTGAVFASFVDKADLFNAVMAEDYERQAEHLRQAVKLDAKVEDAVLSFMEVSYRFHGQQLPLLQAAQSLSWSQGLGGELGNRPTYAIAIDDIVAALERGVERGELKGGGNLRLAAELMWAGYVANYRWAVFEGWDVARLTERAREQIQMVLAGLRP